MVPKAEEEKITIEQIIKRKSNVQLKDCLYKLFNCNVTIKLILGHIY